MKRLILCFSLVLAFGSGYFWGAHRLNKCQDANHILTKDLATAVSRGVVLETNLTLCQEHKK